MNGIANLAPRTYVLMFNGGMVRLVCAFAGEIDALVQRINDIGSRFHVMHFFATSVMQVEDVEKEFIRLEG